VTADERRNRASEEAAQWCTRLQAPDVPRATREDFTAWLRESPLHVAEMLRMAQVHQALEQFEHWATIRPDEAASEDDVLTVLPRMSAAATVVAASRRRATWRLSAVAAVVGVIAVGAALFMISRPPFVQTERAERRELVLSDASIVNVDPETRFRVEFGKHVRRIVVERGRALFRVAHNPARPFIVEAEGAQVRAVGTAFAVERRPRGVVITVAEGKVAVISRNAALGSGSAQLLNPLSAGQQLVIPAFGPVQSVRSVDANRELAWAQGRLIFDNEALSAIVEQFNRYNHLQLHVTDPSLAGRRVSGVFDAADPQSFIAFIAGTAAVQVVRSGDQDVTLTPRAKVPP